MTNVNITYGNGTKLTKTMQVGSTYTPSDEDAQTNNDWNLVDTSTKDTVEEGKDINVPMTPADSNIKIVFRKTDMTVVKAVPMEVTDESGATTTTANFATKAGNYFSIHYDNANVFTITIYQSNKTDIIESKTYKTTSLYVLAAIQTGTINPDTKVLISNVNSNIERNGTLNVYTDGMLASTSGSPVDPATPVQNN